MTEINESKTQSRVIWGIVFFDFILTLVKENVSVTIAAGLTILFFIFFTLAHGLHRLGAKDFWIFFAITFVVSWCYESLSIHTGFPFGHYYYTGTLGPKLGDVPLMIMPAYFGMGYTSWEIAHLLTDHLDRKLAGRDIVAVPAIAAFVMVMWDLSMDPISSTIQHGWIWQNGGGYFDVPLVNFLGWYLCVYTIFQLFAWYQTRFSKESDLLKTENTREFWGQAIIFYILQALGKIVALFSVKPGSVKDLAGISWNIPDIYQGLVVVITFTMGFIAVIATDRLYRLPLIKRSQLDQKTK